MSYVWSGLTKNVYDWSFLVKIGLSLVHVWSGFDQVWSDLVGFALVWSWFDQIWSSLLIISIKENIVWV